MKIRTASSNEPEIMWFDSTYQGVSEHTNASFGECLLSGGRLNRSTQHFILNGKMECLDWASLFKDGSHRLCIAGPVSNSCHAPGNRRSTHPGPFRPLLAQKTHHRKPPLAPSAASGITSNQGEPDPPLNNRLRVPICFDDGQ